MPDSPLPQGYTVLRMRRGKQSLMRYVDVIEDRRPLVIEHRALERGKTVIYRNVYIAAPPEARSVAEEQRDSQDQMLAQDVDLAIARLGDGISKENAAMDVLLERLVQKAA